jgi:hypothetical protein
METGKIMAILACDSSKRKTGLNFSATPSIAIRLRANKIIRLLRVIVY